MENVVGIAFYIPIFSQDLPWTFNIEGDKRAMLTTGQNTSPPPPPPENCFENWKFLLISRGSHGPPLLPACDRRDGEGLGWEECRWTRQGNRVRSCLRMTLSCLLDTAGHSHWSGMAAQAAIGGYSRLQAQMRQGCTQAWTDKYWGIYWWLSTNTTCCC